MATTKEQLHRLVDDLPEGSLDVLADFLGDPFLRILLDTPPSETPLTWDEIVRQLESERDVRAGRVRRFGNVEELIADLHNSSRP